MPAPIRQTSTHFTPSSELSPVQAQVLTALAQGRTITAAADAAGVHRSTVHNWFKDCKPFRAAIDDARDESQEQFRDEMKELAALAIKTLRNLLEDPEASPSVRLKAALAIIRRSDWVIPASIERSVEQDIKKQFSSLEKGLPNPLGPLSAKSEDSTPRNADCPCGSGLKFKRCCGVEALPHLGRQACA